MKKYREQNLNITAIASVKSLALAILCNLVLSIALAFAKAPVQQLYNYQHQRLEAVLVDIALKNDKQLIMQANVPVNEKTTVTCRCSLNEVLTRILKNTRFNFRISENGNILIASVLSDPQQSVHTELLLSNDGYERILVTGYSVNQRTMLQSSNAVTVFNREDFITQGMPNTAEMLKHVPGFWVEDSGGEVNNNVAPRGLRGGEGFRFISIMEDGLPVTYDGIWSDFFQRQDIMISHVETIRGGNSGILSVNGPAAVVNFISVDGIEDKQNEFVVKQGIDYQSTRVDAKFVKQITPKWDLAVGGFYRHSDGIRDPGFTADKGGQVKFVTSYQDVSVQVKLIAKYLNDKTTFYSPIVLTDEKSPRSVAKLSATHGTLISPTFSEFTFKYPTDLSKSSLQYDIEDGQRTKLQSFGGQFYQKINEQWQVAVKSRYSSLSNSMLALINLDNDTIFTADQLLNATQVQDFVAENNYLGVTHAELKNNDSAHYIKTEDTELFTYIHPLFSYYQQYQWLSNATLLFDYGRLSGNFGYLYAKNNYSSLPLDKWLGQYLINVQHQPHRFNIVGVNAIGQDVLNMTRQGQTTREGPVYLDGSGQSFSHSIHGQFFLEFADDFTVDTGIRYERLHLNSSAFTDNSFTDRENFNIKYLSGYQFNKEESFEEVAWNIGLNYNPNRNLAFFANIADAFEMPRLTSFANAIGWSQYVSNIPNDMSFEQPVTLTFGELGLRYNDATTQFTGVLFQTKFEPILFSLYRGNASADTIFMNTITKGVELEFSHVFDNYFSIQASSVWQNAKFNDIPSFYQESTYNGNQITRTPEFQFRFEPQIEFDNLMLALRYHYVGSRFSDVANQRKLPFYQYVDLSAKWQVTDNFSVHLVGKNIFNTFGLTEGNPRTSAEYQHTSYYFARPIFGRSFTASIHLTF